MNAASTAKGTGKGTGKKFTGRHRSAARLAAVQALYEMDMAGVAADPVLGQFLLSRWSNTENDGVNNKDALAEPDNDLLLALVHGVGERSQELDVLIAAELSAKWTLERLETILRAVLRAGAFELLTLPNIPARVVINEYVDVAHAFFSRGEPGLVNSVLDNLARKLRAGEMAAEQIATEQLADDQ